MSKPFPAAGTVVYVTRNALTRGIQTCEVSARSRISDRYLSVKGIGFSLSDSEWHLTREDALIQVVKVITAKMRAMEKAHGKLEKMLSEIEDELDRGVCENGR